MSTRRLSYVGAFVGALLLAQLGGVAWSAVAVAFAVVASSAALSLAVEIRQHLHTLTDQVTGIAHDVDAIARDVAAERRDS